MDTSFQGALELWREQVLHDSLKQLGCLAEDVGVLLTVLDEQSEKLRASGSLWTSPPAFDGMWHARASWLDERGWPYGSLERHPRRLKGLRGKVIFRRAYECELLEKPAFSYHGFGRTEDEHMVANTMWTHQLVELGEPGMWSAEWCSSIVCMDGRITRAGYLAHHLDLRCDDAA